MCISTGPAHFSKTKILTMPMPVGKLHFTAYQNDAENLSNKPNAMILPIPGKTMPEMFIDTSLYNNFLKEIVDAKKELSRGISMKKSFNSFQKFDLGQYTIGLTDSLQGMQDFLESVPVEKKAEISKDLLHFFATHYKGWSFAICLFSASARMESQPIAYTYEPFNYETLFFPTMDSHDGGAPKKDPTFMDHSFIMPANNREISDFFTQPVPDFIKINSYKVIEYEDEILGKTNGDVYVKNGKLDKIYDYNDLLKTVTM